MSIVQVMAVSRTADYNQMNVGWLAVIIRHSTYFRQTSAGHVRPIVAQHEPETYPTLTQHLSNTDSICDRKIASDGELSSALSFLHRTFSPHQITPDTPDTDLIVDKHKSDSSDCGTIVFCGWSEEINLAFRRVNDEQKALWNRGISSFIGRFHRFHLIRPRQTRQTLTW